MPKRKTERFPLTLHHATGQWSKCFTLPSGRRKTVYFGTDRDAALGQYLREREAWQAGRNPRTQTAAEPAGSLADLINRFLDRCKGRVKTGELSPRSFGDYLWTGEQMVKHFGRDLDPAVMMQDDFAGFRSALAAKYAPSRLSKTITVARMIFKWGYDAGHLKHPVRFGPDFKVATKRLTRHHRREAGAKLFTADEIKALLEHADEQFQAAILLGINAGLGNADIASLPVTALDLEAGMLDFPRSKTGVPRRAPLWEETVAALRKVLASRKPRPENESLVFVTSRGGALLTTKPDGKRVDHIVHRFPRLAVAAGIHRPRMGFYWLRHTFQTVGDEARDILATAAVMGHADATMGGHYREGISDERLQAVTDHIRTWLFGSKPKRERKPARRKEKPTAETKPALRIVG